MRNNLKIFLLSISVTVACITHSDDHDWCASDDIDCRLDQLAEANESTGNAILGLIGVGALGYGIYKLSSNQDSAEETKLRAEEFILGLGIQLNNPQSSLRISTLKSKVGLESNGYRHLDINNSIKKNKNSYTNILSVDYNF